MRGRRVQNMLGTLLLAGGIAACVAPRQSSAVRFDPATLGAGTSSAASSAVAPPSEQPSEQPPPSYDAVIQSLRAGGRDDIVSELEKAKKAEEAEIHRLGNGRLVAGRVVIADGHAEVRQVVAQMRILDGGYFLGAVATLRRPIGFRSHGYASVDVRLPSAPTGDVTYVGDVVMKPLAASETASLKGKIVRVGTSDHSTVTLGARIDDAPTNTPSNGTSPRPAKDFPEYLKLPIDAADEFSATGLNPDPYVLFAHGDKYQPSRVTVDFRAGQVSYVTVTIYPKRSVRFTYVVATRPPFAWSAPKTDVVVTGTRWRASGEQWRAQEAQFGNGYGFTLDLEEDRDGVFGHVFYLPATVMDLGQGTLAKFRSIADPPHAIALDTSRVPLSYGHVYLMDHETFDYWVLFEVGKGEP